MGSGAEAWRQAANARSAAASAASAAGAWLCALRISAMMCDFCAGLAWRSSACRLAISPSTELRRARAPCSAVICAWHGSAGGGGRTSS